MFNERVYAAVRRIPAGRVLSYGGVALVAGHPGAARGVGRALRVVGSDSGVPWWRVLNREGRILPRAGHGARLQRALLEAEGVEFDADGRVDLARFGWRLEAVEADPD